MSRANIFDRASIEAVYPRDLFESDAATNSAARSTTSRGVRIESAPDEGGEFRLVRAAHRATKRAAHRDAIFLCPYMGRAYSLFSLAGGVKGQIIENADPFEPHPEEYDAFIERIIETAKRFEKPAPIGRGAAVLRGFRGG
jgi:hypothetical protein